MLVPNTGQHMQEAEGRGRSSVSHPPPAPDSTGQEVSGFSIRKFAGCLAVASFKGHYTDVHG